MVDDKKLEHNPGTQRRRAGPTLHPCIERPKGEFALLNHEYMVSLTPSLDQRMSGPMGLAISG